MPFPVATSFFLVFTLFLTRFIPISIYFRAYANTFEGLLNPIQGYIKAIQGHFCIFSYQTLLPMADLGLHWLNTTKYYTWYDAILLQVTNNIVTTSFAIFQICAWTFLHLIEVIHSWVGVVAPIVAHQESNGRTEYSELVLCRHEWHFGF